MESEQPKQKRIIEKSVIYYDDSNHIESQEPSEDAVLNDINDEKDKKDKTTDDFTFSYFKKKKHFKIFKAFIERILSPVNKLLKSIYVDFSDRSPVRKTIIAMFKLRVPICVLLTIVVVISSCYFLIQSAETASVEMSLNYEESTYGLYPNSTRFNAYEIASQEVVENMLSYSGIDPESVDVNEVISCISIRPTNKKSFSEDNLFITTTYTITLRKPPQIKGVSTQQLLNFLCKAYKDNLYTKYTDNRSILGFDIDSFNDEEYMEIADLFELKASQIEKYLNKRVKQSKTFTEKESDETFKSLVQKVDDLRTYDIAKYRAFIIEAGCSQNKSRYLRALSYINRIKNIDYTKDMAAYNVRNDGIKMYNDAMISVVMIPSIDTEKNSYYMSKTKTGMDYMANQANTHLESAQVIAKEIQINNEIISKMESGDNSRSDLRKADSMIENIRKKFSELSGQIETVDKAYTKYKTKDYLTFKTAHPSFLQKLQPSKLIAIVAALITIIYAAIWFKFRNFRGGKKQ